MAKGCALSTGYLPLGGLPRNSVDRITYRPDMTSAVDLGVKHQPKPNQKVANCHDRCAICNRNAVSKGFICIHRLQLGVLDCQLHAVVQQLEVR